MAMPMKKFKKLIEVYDSGCHGENVEKYLAEHGEDGDVFEWFESLKADEIYTLARNLFGADTDIPKTVRKAAAVESVDCPSCEHTFETDGNVRAARAAFPWEAAELILQRMYANIPEAERRDVDFGITPGSPDVVHVKKSSESSVGGKKYWVLCQELEKDEDPILKAIGNLSSESGRVGIDARLEKIIVAAQKLLVVNS